MNAAAEPQATYIRIFKLLPRATVAELVAAMAHDPELHGRRTQITQAAMLVSFGHASGWLTSDPCPACSHSPHHPPGQCAGGSVSTITGCRCTGVEP